eukprot:TRINITY_DN5759_c0_g1_i1.p1 TRINITY_DN5759_c0_g1~~TRINITY_DN5759_c0_g1_i1.p1  ORF type:complete len:463 (-),score=67.25 TRINITY_DN5759_c0_g1_i1:26-1414(-)
MKWVLVILVIWVVCKSELSIPTHARGGIAYKVYSQSLHSESELRLDEATFVQQLDHFRPGSTFQQRYFTIKSSSGVQDAAPVFLDICGEGPCSGPSGYSRYLVNKYQGVGYALEHRFYGQSVPNNDFSTKNLIYLTVEQAMADLAYFIDQVIAPNHMGPIIVVGGSYSGGLSSWFRQAYPDHTCAALSSSGVVNAIYDFHQFDTSVFIAAGRDCSSLMIKAREGMEKMWDSDRDTLKSYFNVPSNRLQYKGDFFYMIADSSAMAVQYGIKELFCDGLEQAKDTDVNILIQTYANLTIKIWGKDFGSSCFYDTNCLINNPNEWQPTNRAWRWQKCSELAYLQSAPSPNSLRSDSVNLEYMNWQCVTVFGEDYVINSTSVFNEIYGGAFPTSTNVFYSDFSDDPWKEASVTSTVSASQPFVLVECDGCGHCRDLHTPRSSDPTPVKAGRAKFEKYLELWMNQCQ